LQFSQYLRTCREHAHFTQDQLVHKLYVHDVKSFEALDTSILSKWERGVTQPKIAKQVSIVKYFQKETNEALPCFGNYSVEKAESLICEVGMKNLLGKSKKLVLDFPSSVIGIDELKVYHLRNSEQMDRYLEINVDLDQVFNHKYTGLTFEKFRAWAVNPVNSFFVCEYRGQFFGLLFALRVKPEIFEKLLSFEMKEEELTDSDLATFDEVGSNYIISFFAMSTLAANLLFLRYYAHLIANQHHIDEVGIATMMNDGEKLIANMNFTLYKSIELPNDLLLRSYRATLANFLAHEKVLNLILLK